ncbi:MAG: sel1 repeat family protein [Gemmatimonadaceae bacterium]|nr:sel1 repeat family protein [Gemmatimonadaceae bacterium]
MPAPSSQPPAPPPTRRALDAHEKVIIGVTVPGLMVVAIALLTLPSPDAGDARVAPMVTAVRAPVAAPVVDSARQVDSVVPALPIAPKPTAVTKPALAKAKEQAKAPAPTPAPSKSAAKVPTPPRVADNPTRRRGSLCEQHVTAGAWNDAFDACASEAASGKALAQRQLAMLYLEGRGTGRSDQQATKWFTDAANNGDIESMFQFALALERGRGIKKDQSAALRWYTRAADGGHAAAQYALGQAYERGRLGARKDKRQALEWYRKAADQNFGDAADKVRALTR